MYRWLLHVITGFLGCSFHCCFVNKLVAMCATSRLVPLRLVFVISCVFSCVILRLSLSKTEFQVRLCLWNAKVDINAN